MLDPENEGTDAKGIVKRADDVLNSLFHAALAFSAGQLRWAPRTGVAIRPMIGRCA
jgi:hypothetical protein